MLELYNLPEDCMNLVRHKKELQEKLRSNIDGGFVKKKIAILSGATVNEVKDFLELYLLDNEIEPEFYMSSYNQFFEDVVYFNSELKAFNPDVVYVCVSNKNLMGFDPNTKNDDEFENLVKEEFEKFRTIFEVLKKDFNAVLLQNNFEYFSCRNLGCLDLVDFRGKTNFVLKINQMILDYQKSNSNFFVIDTNFLSSKVGTNCWFEERLWELYRCPYSFASTLMLAREVASVICSIYGKSKKVLVLDLDNTLYGGVISECGASEICLGPDKVDGGYFLNFQKYVLGLKNRGIVLAINSKNDLKSVESGLDHPYSVLKLDDFGVIKANYENKADNMLDISKKLNLPLDSMVFLDDSVFEREIVRKLSPKIKVLNPRGKDFLSVLDESGLFFSVLVTDDDLNRTKRYKQNEQREIFRTSKVDFLSYLESLNIDLTFYDFDAHNIDRACQLVNKSNQFNLTSFRYNKQELTSFSLSDTYDCFLVNYKDRFGDEGSIGVVILKILDDCVSVELWVLSCRVLNRNVENLVFEEIKKRTKALNKNKIVGKFIRTEKNMMVEDLFYKLGFSLLSETLNEKIFCLELKN